MANEKNLIPLGDARRSKSEQREIQRKGGVSSGRARSAKAMFSRLLQQRPEDVLSGKALEEIEKMGVNVNGKTFMELGALTTLLQWTMGDMRAGKLAMEISGDDAASERNRLDRARLELEKDRLRAQAERDSAEGAARIVLRREPDAQEEALDE